MRGFERESQIVNVLCLIIGRIVIGYSSFRTTSGGFVSVAEWTDVP